jgi:hypothetical protein
MASAIAGSSDGVGPDVADGVGIGTGVAGAIGVEVTRADGVAIGVAMTGAVVGADAGSWLAGPTE